MRLAARWTERWSMFVCYVRVSVQFSQLQTPRTHLESDSQERYNQKSYVSPQTYSWLTHTKQSLKIRLQSIKRDILFCYYFPCVAERRSKQKGRIKTSENSGADGAAPPEGNWINQNKCESRQCIIISLMQEKSIANGRQWKYGWIKSFSGLCACVLLWCVPVWHDV